MPGELPVYVYYQTSLLDDCSDPLVGHGRQPARLYPVDYLLRVKCSESSPNLRLQSLPTSTAVIHPAAVKSHWALQVVVTMGAIQAWAVRSRVQHLQDSMSPTTHCTPGVVLLTTVH